VSGPAFGSLDDENPESDRATKKRIVAVAAIVLLSAGYFGYTKFHKKTVAQPQLQVQPQPMAPATTTDTSTASVEQQLLAQAPQPVPAETQNPALSATTAGPKSSSEDGVIDSDKNEVADAPPATKTMVVKGGFSRTKTPEEVAVSSDVPAPPTLGNVSGTDQSAISSIVQAATPASVPKVAPRETLKVSQGVTQGLLLKRVQPNYPRQALQMHLQGAVELQAVIGKNGVISSVKILRGEPILARAAAEAVLQWRYKPYLLDGEPVDIQTQITVNFKLP
jgi:TonB family protein